MQKEANRIRKEAKLPQIPFNYTEHRTNLGLLEARRTAVENAKAEFICILDSDDELTPDSLQNLYEAVLLSGAEIVQGKTGILCESESEMDKKRAESFAVRANNVFDGELLDESVFNGFLVAHNHTGFLWGKLIKRKVYLNALSHIPFTNSVFAEDFLQYFFISHEAKKYLGIEKSVYRYRVNTGISSNIKISDLARWEQICSTANVFTIIFEAVKEFSEPLNLEQMEALRLQSRSYLVNNLKQLHEAVIPELRPQARTLLCEYWGEDFVALAEKNQDS